jgi:hypothetical protein
MHPDALHPKQSCARGKHWRAARTTLLFVGFSFENGWSRRLSAPLLYDPHVGTSSKSSLERRLRISSTAPRRLRDKLKSVTIDNRFFFFFPPQWIFST